ncbi:hypothetical protein Tco_1411930 [Tanacetum coccineum]
MRLSPDSECFTSYASRVIDRRAIPNAIPWRHNDTDICDEFPNSYNEGDADRMAEHIILLRKPPRHLLYMCGLAMDYRHPELSQVIKDPEGQVITMDDFLKLPHWNRTVVSKGDPIPEAERPPVCTTPQLAAGALIPKKSPLQRSVEKPNAKIADA